MTKISETIKNQIIPQQKIKHNYNEFGVYVDSDVCGVMINVEPKKNVVPLINYPCSQGVMVEAQIRNKESFTDRFKFADSQYCTERLSKYDFVPTKHIYQKIELGQILILASERKTNPFDIAMVTGLFSDHIKVVPIKTSKDVFFDNWFSRSDVKLAKERKISISEKEPLKILTEVNNILSLYEMFRFDKYGKSRLIESYVSPTAMQPNASSFKSLGNRKMAECFAHRVHSVIVTVDGTHRYDRLIDNLTSFFQKVFEVFFYNLTEDSMDMSEPHRVMFSTDYFANNFQDSVKYHRFSITNDNNFPYNSAYEIYIEKFRDVCLAERYKQMDRERNKSLRNLFTPNKECA